MFPRTSRRAIDKIIMRRVSIGKDSANHPAEVPAVPVPWPVHILEREEPLPLAIIVVNAVPSVVVVVLELRE